MRCYVRGHFSYRLEFVELQVVTSLPPCTSMGKIRKTVLALGGGAST